VYDGWNNLKTVHETRSQSSALLSKRNFYSMRAQDDRCGKVAKDLGEAGKRSLVSS